MRNCRRCCADASCIYRKSDSWFKGEHVPPSLEVELGVDGADTAFSRLSISVVALGHALCDAK